jgi:chromate transport protein ChrA
MSHDSHDIPQGEASQQGIFIGWLAAGLGAFAALFTLFVLISAAIGH